jgi:hypothetical protein
VVIVKRVLSDPPPEGPAPVVADDGQDRLRVDDVLEAHELLRNYAGDMHGLFERVPGR